MKTTKEIRQDFIDFFIEKGHTEVKASSVIPYDDPTLLFTNAGMNQFKDVFLGTGKRDYSRAVNSQKVIRAGGKHNDLDEVGKDSYHHSFFEMLGNWSFGDYYKKEAIEWAWELLTDRWELPKNRLYASVYRTDDEAMELWKSVTDIAHERILRFDEKDNFWQMGETGPCGPCTEIHFDRGEDFCNKKHVPGHVCSVNGDCERIIEVWNLVFIQYDRSEDGKLTELPNKHVDTGMGFERISMVLQGVDSNYHIDLFKQIIDEIEKVTGVKYLKGAEGTPHRVIADHIRSLVFSIADGGLPSNEGRGYVLRRILRRASRYGLKLGMENPFLYMLVEKLCEIMGEMYPEIIKFRKHVENVIKSEEKSFLRTLSKGVALFNEISDSMKEKNISIVPGEDVFRLYDTFGFPKDLTAQMAEESGYTIDENGFNVEMEKQKELSRKGSKFKSEKILDWIEVTGLTTTKFDGYINLSGQSKIVKYAVDGKYLKIVPEVSYFYAESGGQVSDLGFIEIDDVQFEVKNIQKDGEYFVISIEMPESIPLIDIDTMIKQNIDKKFRDDCRIHHSATHLLHASIRKVIGDHVAQAGSYVDSKSLRFDYSHFEKLSEEQIKKIETIVNDEIRSNFEIITLETSIEEAKKMEATALFGEKYGDFVRVVSMGKFSTELCGGTHAKRTGDIGYFKITAENAIASGVRRIEAVCGSGAVELSREHQNLTSYFKESLVCKEADIIDRYEKLVMDKKNLEKEIVALKEKISIMDSLALLEKVEIIKEIKTIRSIVSTDDAKSLKTMAESLRSKLDSGIILLGAAIDGKASLVCAVTDDLKGKYKAGIIVGAAAKIVDGGGGGAPHLATAGGKNCENLEKAINSLLEYI
ncbi:MAG: alanine--tRNA ligase [Candidatus Delongbacteria bacterium]|nr:alanine--tRNA ligase [Candidatus Delongbacteria bacterium]MBN2833768.1 alanine--tRNA ligase [Candidatus Delongbacteria bacterium]